MAVYFIQAGEDGAVKIGIAKDVRSRVSAIQCGSATEIRILRTIEGGKREEAWLHEAFSHLRIRGEWFRFSPDMLTIEAPSIDEPLPRLSQTPFRDAHGILMPAGIQALADNARLSMAQACRQAGIAYSTWFRWKEGVTSPNLGVYQRLVKAVGGIEQIRSGDRSLLGAEAA